MRDSHLDCFALLHLLDAQSLGSRSSIAFKWQNLVLLLTTLIYTGYVVFVVLTTLIKKLTQPQESAASVTDHVDGAKQFNDYGGLLSEGFVEKTERKGKRMSCFFGGNWKAEIEIRAVACSCSSETI